MCTSCNYKLHINIKSFKCHRVWSKKHLNRPLNKGVMPLKTFPIYFLWSIILCSLAMFWQIIGSCYCTFPMTKRICTCLPFQSVFLYQLLSCKYTRACYIFKHMDLVCHNEGDNHASKHLSIVKAVANGPVGQVLAGPLFLKVKTKFHFTKSK